MPLADTCKNALLDQLDTLATHMSLHTAYSTTGTNELTGGSPAYARKANSWSAGASGNKSLSAGNTFDVAAATTVMFYGLWSAITAGTFRGMFPIGSSQPTPFTAADTGDLFTSDAHGLANGDSVVFWDLGAGAVLPTGITEGTRYFVIGVSGDTFQVSTTSGGGAVTLTSDGGGFVQKFLPEVFAGQGTYQVTDADIALAGA